MVSRGMVMWDETAYLKDRLRRCWFGRMVESDGWVRVGSDGRIREDGRIWWWGKDLLMFLRHVWCHNSSSSPPLDTRCHRICLLSCFDGGEGLTIQGRWHGRFYRDFFSWEHQYWRQCPSQEWLRHWYPIFYLTQERCWGAVGNAIGWVDHTSLVGNTIKATIWCFYRNREVLVYKGFVCLLGPLGT